ncbi:hypothetical protein GGR03_003756 [Aurantimonas endophytica]|uniref:Uncharacterized protein n=1 Tax=Aurantimonas endophytica TaxID=1522175 RepID=A0A7W6HGB6_9HYPH|nr:hypothetical protein [Aurantimonas endophytica]
MIRRLLLVLFVTLLAAGRDQDHRRIGPTLFEAIAAL